MSLAVLLLLCWVAIGVLALSRERVSKASYILCWIMLLILLVERML